jgi:hypothetical protein
LHDIDAPELDQTFWWRGQQLLVCGTMALAALEALTAGVKVRCKPVERDRHGRVVAKVFAPDGVDISRRLVSAGGPWPIGGSRPTMSTPRSLQGQARDTEGQLRQALGVACIVTTAGHAGTSKDSPDAGSQAVSRQVLADVDGVGRSTGLFSWQRIAVCV